MRVALGIGGGIAAYKACEVIRGLDRHEVEVQVVMTRAATRFITPLTLQTLSRRKVLIQPFPLDTDETVRHIELTRSVDALVVAPATANLLGKFAHGIADDLLTTLFVSTSAPVLLAPAMNTRMWLHPATQANVRTLASRGVAFVGPEEGWLAEQEEGWGRLAEPERIVAETMILLRRSRSLAGRKVVVTAGPTQEPIDPVRFLSNRSSGKMGYALAAAAARRGAEVVLVSGPVDLPAPYGVRCVKVRTAAQMREAVLHETQDAWGLFMAAAVADFIPRARAEKIKKAEGPPVLILEGGPDILTEVAERRPGLVKVGFAAETGALEDEARRKLQDKGLDFIVANDVSRPDRGMGADDNAVVILDRWGGRREVPLQPKARVAEVVLDAVLERRGKT